MKKIQNPRRKNPMILKGGQPLSDKVIFKTKGETLGDKHFPNTRGILEWKTLRNPGGTIAEENLPNRRRTHGEENSSKRKGGPLGVKNLKPKRRFFVIKKFQTKEGPLDDKTAKTNGGTLGDEKPGKLRGTFLWHKNLWNIKGTLLAAKLPKPNKGHLGDKSLDT